MTCDMRNVTCDMQNVTTKVVQHRTNIGMSQTQSRSTSQTQLFVKVGHFCGVVEQNVCIDNSSFCFLLFKIHLSNVYKNV